MSPESLQRETRNKSFTRLIGGVLLTLIGITAILSAVYVLLQNQQTDKEGFILSNVSTASTTTYAYAIGPQGWESTNTQDGLMAREFKWIIKNDNPTKELFIGITRSVEGYNYLKSFQSVVPQDWSYNYQFYSTSITIPQSVWLSGASNALSRPPLQETFWLSSSHTTDSTSVYWNPQMGKFYLFLMNLDGLSGVEAHIQLGYKVGLLTWLPYALIPLGVILCSAGILLCRRK